MTDTQRLEFLISTGANTRLCDKIYWIFWVDDRGAHAVPGRNTPRSAIDEAIRRTEWRRKGGVGEAAE